MTTPRYLVGLINIAWGLFLMIPLFSGVPVSVIIVVVALILLFHLTGIAFIRQMKPAWTLNILLGLTVILTVIISTLNTLFRKTEIQAYYAPGDYVILAGALLLTFCSLFSVLRTVGRDVISMMSVSRIQIMVTFISGVIISALLIIVLYNALYLV